MRYLRAEKTIGQIGQCIFDQGAILAGAQQQANGRIIVSGHDVALVPADVGVELAEVFVAEASNFQLDKHMALQDSMVEDSVDKAVGVADEDALLARLEAEAVSEFQQKRLEPALSRWT